MVNREAVTSPSHPEVSIVIDQQTPIRAGEEVPLLVRVQETETIMTLDFEGRQSPTLRGVFTEVSINSEFGQEKGPWLPDRAAFQCK